MKVMEVRYKTLDFMDYPNYRVGTDGSVWTRVLRGSVIGTVCPWRRKKEYKDNQGYLSVRLHNGTGPRGGKCFKVGTLVLLAFVGPRPEGQQARHLDDCKQNNQLDNLAWGTRKENHADAVRNGRINRETYQYKRGEDHPMARLVETDVLEIRRLYATGKHTLIGLSSMFGVSWPHIHRIVQRQSWRRI